ncbi:MAG: malto-oligosyltrehalose trehalohydrolase [Myxococcota bacterium]|nr:malto-oligosyltrehalose trehalohydrolase [Myxococcota bacterium]
MRTHESEVSPPSLSKLPPADAFRPPALGATPTAEGTLFALWSTVAAQASVRIYRDRDTLLRTLPLSSRGRGLFSALVQDAGPGTLYQFDLDGREVPDPYARFLPFGVHGPARVEPRKSTPPLGKTLASASLVIYEIHVGAFTREGTYRAAIEKLRYVASLGVTAVELMPLSSFAGTRGWGYDGVAHFAPFAGYGEPEDLRAFVEAAHELGLGVILDAVYNHFGPAGNYLSTYSPEYFTKRHKTAWGDSPDFANPYLRRYVLDNARHWLVDFGFDGLRLDATHGIVDESAPHVLDEIAAMAHALSPRRIVIAEDERNQPSLVAALGLDAVWADDFHHGVRVSLTGEQDGYYCAYRPGARELARTIERGWLYEGQAYPLTGASRGAPAEALDAPSFVYAIQNHDQIGNRPLGSRLNHDVSIEAFAAASMLLLFLPMTPLLFMGQEWAATTPFLFFTDHDQDLGLKISKGRREEFRHFRAFQDDASRSSIPDPQAEETFLRSKLDWSEPARRERTELLELYRTMLTLRREDPVLQVATRSSLECSALGDQLLRVRRSVADDRRTLVVNFGEEPALVDSLADVSCLVMSSPDAWAHGTLAGNSAALFAG